MDPIDEMTSRFHAGQIPDPEKADAGNSNQSAPVRVIVPLREAVPFAVGRATTVSPTDGVKKVGENEKIFVPGPIAWVVDDWTV
jgi:hypothetical protein